MAALNQNPGARNENLALLFQEIFTVIVRLRAGRQPVSDAETFRAQLRNALQSASQEAARAGYSSEDVRIAVFAVVAFLDESILNLQSPVFYAWPSKPLQEELFNVHTAGEVFFSNLDRLLKGSDSAHLGDLLDVHQLCLLLGFRGRFSASARGEIRSLISQIEEKIHRNRGAVGPLSPSLRTAQARGLAAGPDQSKTWKVVAAVCLTAAALLFVLFFVLLGAGTSALQSLAARITL